MNSAVALVDFDRLLNGLDHIYSEFSRACGLSDCAYWMLVDTSTAGGQYCRKPSDKRMVLQQADHQLGN